MFKLRLISPFLFQLVYRIMKIRLFPLRSLGRLSAVLSSRTVGALLCFCGALTLFAAEGYSQENGRSEEDLKRFILQAGDQLGISFPGIPEMDTRLQVRRDGVISAPLVGEVVAEGKTPKDLEQELADMYEGQLVSNEVRVVVLESFFTYYLEGEVRSPGIITSFRQLSVLEAIIAAGGINKNTGKLNSVIVLRRNGDSYQRYDLDLKAILDGKHDNAFVLESYDVVSVPQRIW